MECRTSRTNLWAQIDFQNRDSDGDAEAGPSDGDRWSAIVGFDMNVGPQAVVGASLGKVANRVDFDRYGAGVEGRGYQVGLYASYDPGAFYLKAMGTYNWYDGDSRRRIDFSPLGGTTRGILQGDPDVAMWTLGVHAGARFAMSANSVLTPFLNLDHTSAKLKAFTETGLDGPELSVFDSDDSRTFATGGFKWAAQVNGFVPEARLGYRYRFGDTRSTFTGAFLADEHCDFDIMSESEKRGTVLAGLSMGGKTGPVEIRAGYEGLFNGGATAHSAYFKVVLSWGGQSNKAAQIE